MSRNPIERPDVSEVEHPLSEPPFDRRDFRPERLQGKGTSAVERTTYRDHLDSLLVGDGKYVAITGQAIVGIYDDFVAAVEAACRFAPESVLVKQIVEKESTREVGGNRKTRRGLECLQVAITIDGVALFDIIPTATDLLRGAILPPRTIRHNMNINNK